MWDLAAFVLKALTYASVFSAAGAALFLALFPSLTAQERRSVETATLGLALVGAVLTAMAIPLRAGFLSGTGIGGMFDPFFVGCYSTQWLALAQRPAGSALR